VTVSPKVPQEPEVDTASRKPLGELSSEEVLGGMMALKPTIVGCYQKALKKDASLAGRVIVRFEIESTDGVGVVSNADIQETELDSPSFEYCVLDTVVGASFPPPKGADGALLVVSFPFDFDPGGGLLGEDVKPESERFPGKVMAEDTVSTPGI
jgi:hypothetical protein